MKLAPILFVFTSYSYAFQEPPPPPPMGPVPPGLPIDNSLIFLFVLGLVYGVWKLNSFRKSAKC